MNGKMVERKRGKEIRERKRERESVCVCVTERDQTNKEQRSVGDEMAQTA